MSDYTAPHAPSWECPGCREGFLDDVSHTQGEDALWELESRPAGLREAFEQWSSAIVYVAHPVVAAAAVNLAIRRRRHRLRR